MARTEIGRWTVMATRIVPVSSSAGTGGTLCYCSQQAEVGGSTLARRRFCPVKPDYLSPTMAVARRWRYLQLRSPIEYPQSNGTAEVQFALSSAITSHQSWITHCNQGSPAHRLSENARPVSSGTSRKFVTASNSLGGNNNKIVRRDRIKRASLLFRHP